MRDHFLEQTVTSEAVNDFWVFRLGPNRLQIPYQLGFQILTGILLACKMAMQIEGVPAKDWEDYAKVTERDPTPPIPHSGFRRSNDRPNITAYDVAFDGPLVVLKFTHVGGEVLTAQIHFKDMLKIYTSARAACKSCKAWAGDGSRIWNGRAHLGTVEENKRLGLT